jgi:hypothetical protein
VWQRAGIAYCSREIIGSAHSFFAFLWAMGASICRTQCLLALTLFAMLGYGLKFSMDLLGILTFSDMLSIFLKNY